MRLGVNVPAADAAATARLAEQLGFDVALVPEGYRSDAPSVLGLLAGCTTSIGLASGVLQMPGRTPVMTAMTTAMLDALSGGRFRLGLGVSNVAVTSGWHGQPFDDPVGRIREYVTIVRAALTGEPVRHHGRHFHLPLDGHEGFRLSTPLHAPELPVYLAAVGPRSLELAGEIADGWFGVFCSPERIRRARELLDRGTDRRAPGDRTGRRFEVMPSVPIVVDDDVERAATAVRGYVARFVSLGHRRRNVYHRLMTEAGFGAAADRVQDRFAAGDLGGAAAEVPLAFLDTTALLGPPDRVAAGVRAYATAGVTTLALSPFAPDPDGRAAALHVAADALRPARPMRSLR